MTTSYKAHFTRFLSSDPRRLHFAAHSHHLWPDVTRAAQLRAWDVAAERVDDKWSPIFGELLPRLQRRIADVLDLSEPRRLAFAPNVHEFLTRVVSTLPTDRAVRVLSSDSEFHSFRRQCERWGEAGRVEVVQVPTEPFDTFEARFLEAAARTGFDLVYVSQVFFNSGFVFEALPELARVTPAETVIMVDGYHGFMALPTSLRAVEERVFYTAGGYKYAMSGEGACFMHCPDGYLRRPVNTGWFAAFGDLADAPQADATGYATGGQRFWGATLDPSGLFRMDAVLGWLDDIGLDVAAIHEHVRGLQGRFLAQVQAGRVPGFDAACLLPGPGREPRGHFLSFRTPDAGALHDRMQAAGVVTDHRGDVLRVGFGIYQDPADVDALCDRIRGLG